MASDAPRLELAPVSSGGLSDGPSKLGCCPTQPYSRPNWSTTRSYQACFIQNLLTQIPAGSNTKEVAEHNLSDSERTQKGMEELNRLQSENQNLAKEIDELKQELKESRDTNRCTMTYCPHSVELLQVKQELSRYKETLQAMKADRKRLKSDKLDLVSQMKQLYHTLEDKESELREFIRSYEQRMTDVTDRANRLALEKEDLEQQKDAAVDQCQLLKSMLEMKDDQNLSGINGKLLNNAVRSSFSEDSILKLTTIDGHYSSSGDDLPPYQEIYVLDMSNQSPALPRSSSISEGHLHPNLQKSFQKSSQLIRNQSGSVQCRDSRERIRMESMAFTKKVNDDSSPKQDSFILQQLKKLTAEQNAANRISFVADENLEEKLRTVAEASELPVSLWRANHVLSWLEITMNMSAYAAACADNIKSGKVLLGLSDTELESALRLQSALHRRKLRLAVEELRVPSSIQFALASKISHTWVSEEWVASLGLPQFVKNFDEQLVDGRLLNVLTKKDLDKHLGVHKKFHQSSIAYGIDLLRLLDFDKDEWQQRRLRSRENFTDPIIWANDQVIEWANHIDLHEYSQNLKESGIHGAVLVFEQSFTSDVFATALGIPTSKAYVRRHLSTELDAIIRPARAALEESKQSKKSGSSSFTRSFSGGNKSETEIGGGANRGSGSGRKLSFRGSLGRAFGRRSTKDTSCDRSKEVTEPSKTSNTDLLNSSISKPRSGQ